MCVKVGCVVCMCVEVCMFCMWRGCVVYVEMFCLWKWCALCMWRGGVLCVCGGREGVLCVYGSGVCGVGVVCVYRGVFRVCMCVKGVVACVEGVPCVSGRGEGCMCGGDVFGEYGGGVAYLWRVYMVRVEGVSCKWRECHASGGVCVEGGCVVCRWRVCFLGVGCCVCGV